MYFKPLSNFAHLFNFHNMRVKGVLNPNYRPFSLEFSELNKNRFFKMNFYLGFRVL